MSLTEGADILDGRFKIIKKLGSGAFGEIFKVQKKKSGEFYAAKIVSFEFFDTVLRYNNRKKPWKIKNMSCYSGKVN